MCVVGKIAALAHQECLWYAWLTMSIVYQQGMLTLDEKPDHRSAAGHLCISIVITMKAYQSLSGDVIERRRPAVVRNQSTAGGITGRGCKVIISSRSDGCSCGTYLTRPGVAGGMASPGV